MVSAAPGPGHTVWVLFPESRAWRGAMGHPAGRGPAPTFLGENTPRVPPSSLMATPISASSASLGGQSGGQLEPPEATAPASPPAGHTAIEQHRAVNHLVSE